MAGSVVRADVQVTILCCACKQPIEMGQAEAQRLARRMFREELLGCEHQVDGVVNCPPSAAPPAAGSADRG
jgi:hypothetical protein